MTEPADNTELRDLAQVLARALFMIVSYLNRRYRLGMKLKDPDDGRKG